MGTLKEFEDKLLKTGLFSREHSLLLLRYKQSYAYNPECDFVLNGVSNVIYYTTWKTWYLISADSTDFLSSKSFEEILDLVPQETRTQLLFHLDLFTGEKK